MRLRPRWTLHPFLLAMLSCGGSGDGAAPRSEPTPEAKTEPARSDPTPPADDGSTPSEPTPEPIEEPTPAAAIPNAWAALPTPPSAMSSSAMTPEGIPVLEVDMSGGARWDLDAAWDTLKYGKRLASDGQSIVVAVREEEGRFTDVVIRGSEVQTNVLRRFAGTDANPGGCGAARDGTLLLSAPVPDPSAAAGAEAAPDPDAKVQAVWVMKPDGTIVRHTLPAEAGTSAECTSVVESPPRFSVFAEQLVEFDGERVESVSDWRRERTWLTKPFGPRYCFIACNDEEKAGTDPALLAAIEGALGDCIPRYAVYGDHVAARCFRTPKAVRVHVPSKKVETVYLPKTNHGVDDLYFTRNGDVVIELGILLSRYAVWPAGTETLTAPQSVELDEVLMQASPTVLVRGLPKPLPRAEVSPVALGKPLRNLNPRDIDRANHSVDRGPGAHEARSERAAAVMPKDPFMIVHEAAVQLSCGAYVRSPIGYEHEPFAHDFDPPTMPPLSPKAVHQPSPCLPLAEVHALPGDADLLLAKTADGRLATAWLPPPLPFVAHTDARRPPPPMPTPVAVPEPGPGWVVLGAVDSIEGIAGMPSPGKNPPEMTGWQQGGGAVLTVGEATLVITPKGVWTVPAGTTPMAVQILPKGRLFGAIGSALVVCDESCRTYDPGDERPILSVVPRTEMHIVLGYGDKEEDAAIYQLPKTGGVLTPPHALEESLRAQLRSRPAG